MQSASVSARRTCSGVRVFMWSSAIISAARQRTSSAMSIASRMSYGGHVSGE